MHPPLNPKPPKTNRNGPRSDLSRGDVASTAAGRLGSDLEVELFGSEVFLGVWGFGIYGPLDLGSWGFLAVLWICGVCLKFWFWGLGALGFRVLGSFWRFFGSVWCFF